MKRFATMIITAVFILTLLMPVTAYAGTSFSSASSISANRSYTCTISTSGTTQYYYFTPSVTGEYTFYSSGNIDTVAYIYNSSQQQLYYNDDGGEGTNFSISCILNAGNKYYFAAKLYNSSSTGSFSIMLRQDSTTSTIYTGSSYSCSISASGMKNYYQFSPTTSGTYVFSSTGSYDTFGYLYDSGMNLITTDNDSGNSNNFSISYYLYSGNTYYFAASMNGSGTGTFRVEVSMMGSSISSATDIYEFETQTCSDSSGSNKYYRFQPTRTGNFTFFSVGACDTYGTLYNSSGSAIISNDDSGQGYNFVFSSYLYSGNTYYLGANAPSGSFDVGVFYGEGFAALATLTGNGNFYEFTYTPSSSNVYEIFTYDDYDTIGQLEYGGTVLDSDDDSGEGSNFYIKNYLYYNGRYLIKTRYFSTSRSGSFIVYIRKTTCSHSSTEAVVYQTATTSRNGELDTYCKECGYLISEANIPKISKATLSTTKYKYDKKAKKPSVAVYDANNKKISSDNYTVSYSSNTNIGTATATIKFKNKYSGTMKKTFTIVPPGTTFSSVKAPKKTQVVLYWKKVSGITGYQVQVSENSEFKNASSTNAKASATSMKKTVKYKKTYYIRIRTYKTVKDKKYYSDWSSKKKIKIS